MKSKLLNIIVGIFSVVLLPLSGRTQNWAPQTSGTTAWLEKVQFVNDEVGWCVGSNGTILHTSDAGMNWTSQPSNTDVILRDIHMFNEYEGWIIGHEGVILHTQNGGMSWELNSIGGMDDLRTFWFSEPMNCWMSGSPDLIRFTNDGCVSWSVVVPGSLDELNSMWFLDDGVYGWAAGLSHSELVNGSYVQHGQMRFTADGGTNWMLSTQAFDFGWFQAVQFFNATDGWACTSRGEIVRSIDGGITWQLEYQGPATGYYDLLFVDEMNGFCVGGGGLILTTNDGGVNWSDVSSGTSAFLYDIHIRPSGKAWIVGLNGTILHNADLATMIKEVNTIALSIYPQPASDELNVQWTNVEGGVSDVLILDMTGKVVMQESFLNSDIGGVTVDLSHIESGMYVLQCVNSWGSSSQRRFIVAK